MRKRNRIPRKSRYLQALGVWSLDGFEHEFKEKPIKVKLGKKPIILEPTHPLYNATKWYGEYEEV
jgi:hypothetical protein